MTIRLPKWALTAVAGLLCSVAAIAQPTDNPYRTYNSTLPANHWTDSIKWNQVFPITNYASLVTPAIDGNGNTVDNWLPAYNAARDAAAAAGGGVVFFPRRPLISTGLNAGDEQSYFIGDHLYLVSGVVLRGENPHPDSADAMSKRFKPAVYLEFPKYDYSSTLGRPFDAADNAKAFKNIRYTPGVAVQNSGLVNLDINRAGLVLMPRFASVVVPDPSNPTQTQQTKHAIDNCRNILLMGLRVNNYIEPTPEVPAAGSQDGSQRYPWRFGSPFNIYVKGNCIVANNRINDADSTEVTSRGITSESFVMANYRTSGGGTIASVTFDYTRAYGILVNRFKREFPQTSSGFLSYATAASEPDLFVTGIVVERNWIFHTSRVGIQVGGSGTIVRNNVIRDTENKSTALNPQGTALNANAIATFENRGIDVSGQGILVESNDIQVYRTQFVPPSTVSGYSADGEGFYCQMQGGAQSSDLTFRDNTVRTSLNGMNAALNAGQKKGFNGVNNAISVRNILIENNRSGGMPIWVQAQNSATSAQLDASNVVIRNNTEVSGVVLEATAGGSPSFVYGNIGRNPSYGIGPYLNNRLQVSCHVWLNPDLAQPRNVNTNVNLIDNANCTPVTQNNVCGTPFPEFTWVTPTSDIFYTTAPASENLTVQLNVPSGPANCGADSVVFFINGIRDGNGTFGTVQNSYDYTVNFPAGAFDYLVTAVAYVRAGGGGPSPSGNYVMAYSSARRLSTVVGTKNQLKNNLDAKLFPNPASHTAWLEAGKGAALQVAVVDMLGRQVRTLSLQGQDRYELDLTGLNPGLYNVLVSDGATRTVRRLQVQ